MASFTVFRFFAVYVNFLYNQRGLYSQTRKREGDLCDSEWQGGVHPGEVPQERLNGD